MYFSGLISKFLWNKCSINFSKLKFADSFFLLGLNRKIVKKKQLKKIKLSFGPNLKLEVSGLGQITIWNFLPLNYLTTKFRKSVFKIINRKTGINPSFWSNNVVQLPGYHVNQTFPFTNRELLELTCTIL